MNKKFTDYMYWWTFYFDFLKCLKYQKKFKFKIIGTDKDPKAYGKF